MSVDNTKLNKEMYNEIKNIVDLSETEETPLILLGDFNAHVGFLGSQKINKNGELLLKSAEDNNLILLNDHPSTEGLITWKRNDQESVIDFILVNNKMLNFFQSMIVDESKSMYDLSDHNFISATFLVMLNAGPKQKSEEFIEHYTQKNM